MFTGGTHAIKHTTVTFEQRLAERFPLRQEWRRDSSSQPYFPMNALSVLKKERELSVAVRKSEAVALGHPAVPVADGFVG